MLSYNEDILQLTYDAALDVVIMEWTGFANSAEFREANEAVLSLLREKHGQKLMADVRNMKIISVSDQQWLYQNWLPRAIKAGLMYTAIIESDDFFNRLSVDNVVQKINDQLTIKYFNSILSARSWFRNL